MASLLAIRKLNFSGINSNWEIEETRQAILNAFRIHVFLKERILSPIGTLAQDPFGKFLLKTTETQTEHTV